MPATRAAKRRLFAGCPSLYNGLFAAYGGQEASGDLLDLSGNGRTLTANAGPTTNPGPSSFVPGARQLARASSQYFSVADSDPWTFPGSFTVSLWAWLDTAGAATWSSGLSKFSAADGEYLLPYYDSGVNRWLAILCPSGSFAGRVSLSANSFGAVSAGVWMFVRCWLDVVAQTMNIQVNNGPIDSTAFTSPLSNTTNPVNLGCWGGGANEFWDGRMGGITIHTRVLVDKEASYLWSQGQGRLFPFAA